MIRKLLICAFLAPVSTALAQPTVAPINLQPGPVITLPAGASPSAVAIAEFNQDFRRDVAVCQRGLGSVSVYLQLPNGTFSTTPVGTYPAGSSPTGLVAVPLGDGRQRADMDLIAVNGPSNSFTFLTNNNNGTGTFTPVPNVSNNRFLGTSPKLVATNLNNNGLVDLIYDIDDNSAGQGGVYWRELESNISLRNSASTAYQPGYAPAGFALADFDRDGISDVVTSHPQLNRVDVAFALRGSTSPRWGSIINIRIDVAGIRPGSIVATDVNRDQLPDIIVANEESRNISVILNLNNDTFGAQALYPLPAAPRQLLLADLNGDNAPEMLVLTANNQLQIFQHTTSGGANRYGAPIALATGADPVTLQVADINEDFKPDVVVSCAGDNTVRVYLNQTITLAARPQQLAGTSIYPNPATDQVIVKLPATLRGPVSAVLLDVLGREVRRTVMVAPNASVPVADLPRGVYVLRLEAAQGVLSQRIVVQ